MSDIPDFTESEHWIIDTTLKERYGRPLECHVGDAEIRLEPADRQVTQCPVVHWQVQDCSFVVFKSGERRYRCQFYYRGYQQYGTGVHEYDDLTECMVGLLQAQADHEAEERGDLKPKRR